MTNALSKDNVRRKLIFNESILLAHRDDSIEFTIPQENTRIQYNTLIIRFDDSGDQFSSSVNPSKDERTLDMTLHKWYAPTFVETLEPMLITAEPNLTWWVVIRTQSLEKQSGRILHISIWESDNG